MRVTQIIERALDALGDAEWETLIRGAWEATMLASVTEDENPTGEDSDAE